MSKTAFKNVDKIAYLIHLTTKCSSTVIEITHFFSFAQKRLKTFKNFLNLKYEVNNLKKRIL